MAKERRQLPRESLDGFLFNVEKFFGSVSCQRMSFSEKGVYLVMIFQQWRAGGLPDDAAAVADLIAVTEAQVADVVAAWPVVRRKFTTHEDNPAWITNVALEETRRKQRRYLNERAKAGRRGGEAKSRNARHVNTLPSVAKLQQNVAQLQQIVAEPQQNVAQLYSSLGIREEKSREDQSREDERGGESSAETLPRSSPAVLLFPTDGKVKEWALTETQLADWITSYPSLDVEAEARKALAWVNASGTHRKTAGGMGRFLVNWFNRSIDKGTGARHGTGLVSEKTAANIAGDEEAIRLITAGEFGYGRRG